MNNIENSFKEALTDFDYISPSNGLWARISTSLLLKSTAFRAIMWSLLALLIITIPSVYISSQSQERQIRIWNNRMNTSASTNYKLKNNKASSKSNNEIISTEHSNFTSKKTDYENENIAQITKDDKNKASAENSIVLSKNPSSEVISQQRINSEKSETIKPEPKEDNIAHQQNNSKANIATLGVIAAAAQSPAPSTVNNNGMESLTKTDFLAGQTVSTITSYGTNNIETQESFEIEKVNTINSTPEYQASIGLIESTGYKPLYQYKQRYSSQLEIFAGPNIAYNNLEVNDPTYNEHISLRLENEDPKLSYHLGINYKTYYEKWFISLGINYHRIEDRATYSLPTIDIDSAMSSYMVFRTTYNQAIVGYVQNPNDTSSLLPIIELQVSQDTSFVNEVYYDSTKSVKRYSYTNSYSFIEVPLMIGREFRYKHFVFDIVGGISWQRLIKYQVNIPNMDNNRLLDLNQTETILVHNTFNGILGLGVGYQLNEGYVLFARPDIRYNLNSMFEKDYPVSQKYLQLRISIGIRIQL